MSRAWCMIKAAEGGYIIEWRDYSAGGSSREIICATAEALGMRIKRLFESTEGRLTEPCTACNGEGFVAGDNTGYLGLGAPEQKNCRRCKGTGEQEKKRDDSQRED